ncbi:MAG: hypothetical protein LBH32_04625 [Dysgonamonadaceae bacterium]|jgi:hypothetical protein|nr:hypothetical protein [Dysgonamonadaceae bacterium]
MEIIIPQEVKEKIKSHLNSAIKEAIAGFLSVYESEDTCTGDLFRLMKTKRARTVVVDDEKWGGKWKWSIDYNKFGSGGTGSTESILGFDGIFVLSIIRNGYVEEKTLLFQSKIEWRKKDIYEQCKKMLPWLGAATIINYTEESFDTYKIEEVFNNLGEKAEKSTLQETLSGDFLDCNIGDFDLHYDAIQKKLIWRDISSEYVFTKLNLNRKLKIKIEAPNRFPYESVQNKKEISNDEMLLHRLRKGYSKFDVKYIWNKEELESIKSEFDKIFNKARNHSFSEKENSIFLEIISEFNRQYEEKSDYFNLEELKKKLTDILNSFVVDNFKNQLKDKEIEGLQYGLKEFFLNEKYKHKGTIIEFIGSLDDNLQRKIRNKIVQNFHPDTMINCSSSIKYFCENVTKTINSINTKQKK